VNFSSCRDSFQQKGEESNLPSFKTPMDWWDDKYDEWIQPVEGRM